MVKEQGSLLSGKAAFLFIFPLGTYDVVGEWVSSMWWMKLMGRAMNLFYRFVSVPGYFYSMPISDCSLGKFTR